MKFNVRQDVPPLLRRSPHGERGLKSNHDMEKGWEGTSLPPRGAWIEIVICCRLNCLLLVAPPTGSVD